MRQRQYRRVRSHGSAPRALGGNLVVGGDLVSVVGDASDSGGGHPFNPLS